MAYEHSVLLDESKCTGCTTCLRHCPTEAIRIKDGHAVINEDRCIDCGECIRVCPHHAKYAERESLTSIVDYKYRIALPAPALYGQFSNVDDINIILNALKRMGFDEVAAEGYSPQTGDIVVFPKVDGHIWGHIQMWNGRQWISDFMQKGFYAAAGYRECGYRIFRR